MIRRRLITLLAVAVSLFVACDKSSNHPDAQTSPSGALVNLLGGDPPAGFARATRPVAFEFPRDHGAHENFRSEWWYFSGHLRTPGLRRFGYQFTIFRFALSPDRVSHPSEWATNQIYMGHFAVTDVSAARFHFSDRLTRESLGLAGAEFDPLRIWVEDWEVAAINSVGADQWRLRAHNNGIALDLVLSPSKPPIAQGQNGLSQKGPVPGNASYYYSMPRLQTRGNLRIGSRFYQVSGSSWLDREWSTSALSEGQVGWDWFAVNLADGYDLMYYQLRRQDGAIDPRSAGVLIDPEGKGMPLTSQDVTLRVLETWAGGHGSVYPIRWQIDVTPVDLTLLLTPLLKDQELRLDFDYWEGAVDAVGHHLGRPVSGEGYVELTGYAR